MTAELVILYLKLMWVLLAAEPRVTAVEVMASLPDYDEVHTISMAYNATSTVGAMGWLPSAAYLLALVCEKFGRFEEAAPWAEAASSNDCGRLGTKRGAEPHGCDLDGFNLQRNPKFGGDSTNLRLEELQVRSRGHSLVAGGAPRSERSPLGCG